ncbi:MAG: FapA family protein [Oscillospiraceae bacterium]|nr:FapA family protein [Oscillospiraceae bacterium]
MGKSKTRIFTANSREAAEAMAADYFDSNKNDIVFETISEDDENSEFRVFAFNGTKGQLADLDASFGLYYESDGVYLELYRERGLGKELDRLAISQYIVRKNLTRLDEASVQLLLIERVGRARIAPDQEEFFFGEDITVEIPQYEMEARVTLLAPEPGGAEIGLEAAKEKILQAGVTHGLDEQALSEVLQGKKYGQSIVVATATQAVDGENGKLVFNFQTDPATGRPRELEDGKVDYKDLSLFVPCNEGQLLVSRTVATEGTAGSTVKGKVIKQRPGKNVTLPKGKNVIINADKTEMFAETSGMVEYIHGSVNVTNIYMIDGDVDVGVGNIDFDGSVQVSGNVLSGHVIKASGGVVIGGVVEASEIISGGNVEVKRGMQGMDRGRIEAAGSISMLYIERGTAIAGGTITVDASIHSLIEAGESLHAKGKRGSIIGGRAIAADEIVANSIGSVSQAQTEVEVGVMPYKRAKLSELEKEMEKLAGEMTKLDQLDTYLSRAKEKLDEETYDKLYRSGKENRKNNTEQMAVYTREINDLKDELEHAISGRIHVFDTVYAGARIIIGTDTLKVHDDIQYATFKFKEGQVSYTPCEIKRN